MIGNSCEREQTIRFKEETQGNEVMWQDFLNNTEYKELNLIWQNLN